VAFFGIFCSFFDRMKIQFGKVLKSVEAASVNSTGAKPQVPVACASAPIPSFRGSLGGFSGSSAIKPNSNYGRQDMSQQSSRNKIFSSPLTSKPESSFSSTIARWKGPSGPSGPASVNLTQIGRRKSEGQKPRSCVGQFEMNQKEVSVPYIEAVQQRLFDLTVHTEMKKRFEALVQRMHGREFQDSPISTFSAISTPDLLTSSIREEILREGSKIDFNLPKAILSNLNPRSPLWTTRRYQASILAVYKEMAQELESKLTRFKAISKYDSKVLANYDVWQNQLETLKMVMSVLEKDVVSLNVHPLSKSDKKMGGIYMRVAGPSTTGRARSYYEHQGRYSIGSSTDVRGESVNHVLTKNLGVFGVRCRIVYGKSKDIQTSSEYTLKSDFGKTPFNASRVKGERPLIRYYSDKETSL
jgi:hypothetical protein